jgi:hypothetical protein
MITVPGSIPKMIFEKLCKEQVNFEQNKQKLNRISKSYYLSPILLCGLAYLIQPSSSNPTYHGHGNDKKAFIGNQSWKLWLSVLLMPVN